MLQPCQRGTVYSCGPLCNLSNVQKPNLRLVQSDMAEGGKAGAFVAAPQGLFPAPLPPSRQGSRLLPRFTLLGRAAAKALQDGRMLDVPLSYTFYRCAAAAPLHVAARFGGHHATYMQLVVIICSVAVISFDGRQSRRQAHAL
jgi:hypothetical protein